MYLSFLRINIALESDVHRVQLQSIVDEEEQVQRGAAELCLSSYRINNAEEEAVDY